MTAYQRLQLEQEICTAIRQWRVLRFRYAREFTYRAFEPYVVYRSGTGRIVVSGMQTADDAKPQREPEPRKFELGLIRNLHVTGQCFEAVEGFSSYGPEFGGQILCAVDRR